MSDSQPGEPVAAFPHLASAYRGALQFKSKAQIIEGLARLPRAALFWPHRTGAGAPLIDSLLTGAEQAGTRTRVVDISADFRYCAPPQATRRSTATRTAHPGASPSSPARCRNTLGRSRRRTWRIRGASPPPFCSPPCRCSPGADRAALFVAGVTGSTGSGRKPRGHASSAAPRRSVRYNALAHRHAPEVRAPRARGQRHRGAHQLRAAFRAVRPRHPRDGAGGARGASRHAPHVLTALRGFYQVARSCTLRTAPRVKDVVTSNFAHLSAVANGRTVAVMCVLDVRCRLLLPPNTPPGEPNQARRPTRIPSAAHKMSGSPTFAGRNLEKAQTMVGIIPEMIKNTAPPPIAPSIVSTPKFADGGRSSR